jgi:hypothetical protein
VRSELLEEADVLGLDADEIRALSGHVGKPNVGYNRVLTGNTVQPPAIEVEVRHSSGGGWVLNYSFSFRDPP